ncbi:MAG: hypothetical protein H6710_01880 [Myxococcales bacterium]|nr:hypothetical protein [Myxococcales bacterium]
MVDPSLRDFERIVFFTGAGMSAERGVPTYRGAGGIWRSTTTAATPARPPSRATPTRSGSSTISAASS